MIEIQAADTAVSIRFIGERPPAGRALEELVRRALAERGLAPWSGMRAECFAADDQTLVIARPARDCRPAFLFEDLEPLLAGALACSDGPSALYTYDDGYLLAVDGDGAGPALYEFGQALCVRSAWERHAAEQGLCLIPENAIAALRKYFGGQM